jgi:hypothetical protein
MLKRDEVLFIDSKGNMSSASVTSKTSETIDALSGDGFVICHLSNGCVQISLYKACVLVDNTIVDRDYMVGMRKKALLEQYGYTQR